MTTHNTAPWGQCKLLLETGHISVADPMPRDADLEADPDNPFYNQIRKLYYERLNLLSGKFVLTNQLEKGRYLPTYCLLKLLKSYDFLKIL